MDNNDIEVEHIDGLAYFKTKPFTSQWLLNFKTYNFLPLTFDLITVEETNNYGLIENTFEMYKRNWDHIVAAKQMNSLQPDPNGPTVIRF